MPETLINSTHLLTDALHILGHPSVLANASGLALIINRLPRHGAPNQANVVHSFSPISPGNFVTGLRGTSSVAARGSALVHGKMKKVEIKAGTPWELRWDFDPVKGVHINVDVGSEKFAVMYPGGKCSWHQSPADTQSEYLETVRTQTQNVGYFPNLDQRNLPGMAHQLAMIYTERF